MTTKSSVRLNRRLLPLYLAQFFQAFVLWYAVEMYFQKTIGFNDATIALSVIFCSVVILVVETPSGLLADRWSRKGVLMLAGFAMAISSLVAGLSTDVGQYFVAVLFGGIFVAFYTGAYDSIVYDTLTEETGNADEYERYYGRIKLLDGLALILSSLLGGVVGQYLGFKWAYLLTVPVALLSVAMLVFLKEPKLHLAHEHVTVKAQIKSTTVAITNKGIVVYLLVAIVFAGQVARIVFEFDQLWLIALATPVFLYGPINAIILSSVVVGGGIVPYVTKHKQAITTLSMVVLVAASVSMALIRNIISVVISIFLIAVIMIIFEIFFSKQLHDRLASNVRSGAMSAVSTLSRIMFLLTAFGLGFSSHYFGIFNAAWVLVCLSIITSVIILRTSVGLDDITENTVDPSVFKGEPYERFDQMGHDDR